MIKMVKKNYKNHSQNRIIAIHIVAAVSFGPPVRFMQFCT